MHALPLSSLLGYAAVTALIAWRVYVRFRRAVGPQRLSRYRAPLTYLVYGVLLLALLPSLLGELPALATLLIAMALGAGLGQLALRRTVFNARPGRLTYTPYAPIALSLAVLFVVRLAYRLVELLFAAPHEVHGLAEFVHSPLTLCAFGLWVGYVLRYTAGLAAWRRRVLAAKQAREAQRDEA